MVEYMKTVAISDVDLNIEERNLLSVAYKNVIGARRASWRVLSSMEQNENAESEKAQLCQTYRKTIEEELSKTCLELIDLIQKHLFQPSSTSNFDSQVFYKKMEGDYYRYLAEFSDSKDRESNERETYADKSLAAYKEAHDISGDKLPPTHPIRLGLALNFSVFYYEILNKPDRACQFAKAAFDDAIKELDSVTEEDYKDSTLIMQLLRDNLTLWTGDLQDDDDKGELQDIEQEEA